jgi:hypothetical protein
MDCSNAWYWPEALAKALAEAGVEVKVVIAVEAVERRVEMSLSMALSSRIRVFVFDWGDIFAFFVLGLCWWVWVVVV